MKNQSKLTDLELLEVLKFYFVEIAHECWKCWKCLYFVSSHFKDMKTFETHI